MVHLYIAKSVLTRNEIVKKKKFVVRLQTRIIRIIYTRPMIAASRTGNQGWLGIGLVFPFSKETMTTCV